MNIELVTEIYREMLRTAALVAAPILGTAMLIGLSVSILQTLTCVNEQTLTFVPKIAGIALVIGWTLFFGYYLPRKERVAPARLASASWICATTRPATAWRSPCWRPSSGTWASAARCSST